MAGDDQTKSSYLKDLEEIVPPALLRYPRSVIIGIFRPTTFANALDARDWTVITTPVYFLTTSLVIYTITDADKGATVLDFKISPSVISMMALFFIPLIVIFHALTVAYIKFFKVKARFNGEPYDERQWHVPSIPVTFFVWCYLIGLLSVIISIVGLLLRLAFFFYPTWCNTHGYELQLVVAPAFILILLALRILKSLYPTGKGDKIAYFILVIGAAVNGSLLFYKFIGLPLMKLF